MAPGTSLVCPDAVRNKTLTELGRTTFARVDRPVKDRDSRGPRRKPLSESLQLPLSVVKSSFRMRRQPCNRIGPGPTASVGCQQQHQEQSLEKRVFSTAVVTMNGQIIVTSTLMRRRRWPDSAVGNNGSARARGRMAIIIVLTRIAQVRHARTARTPPHAASPGGAGAAGGTDRPAPGAPRRNAGG